LFDKAWRVTLPFAISVFLIQGFFWPQGTPIFWVGPFSLKKEGLYFAIAGTGRILVVVSSFLWFALTTRPDALMTALAQRGFPSSLAYIIAATIQIIPRFQARANTIIDAQRARGLETEGGLLRRLRAVLPLVVPLILSSLVDVEERALAVEARGFSSPNPKTSLIEVREARWEPIFRWTLVAGMVAFVGLRFLL
jgi:energy-coupling factor transport system permease protein